MLLTSSKLTSRGGVDLLPILLRKRRKKRRRVRLVLNCHGCAHRCVSSGADIVERGEDEAAQTIYQPSTAVSDKARQYALLDYPLLTDLCYTILQSVDTLLSELRKLPTYAIAGVDLIDRTLALVRDGDTAAALTAARKLKQTDLGHAIWSKEDQTKLVEGAAHHGNDIEDIADEIESKSIADIVKRYYMVLG